MEQERVEKEQLEKQQLEQERVEKEQLEKQCLEQERIEKHEQECAEKQNLSNRELRSNN